MFLIDPSNMQQSFNAVYVHSIAHSYKQILEKLECLFDSLKCRYKNVECIVKAGPTALC